MLQDNLLEKVALVLHQRKHAKWINNWLSGELTEKSREILSVKEVSRGVLQGFILATQPIKVGFLLLVPRNRHIPNIFLCVIHTPVRLSY